MTTRTSRTFAFLLALVPLLAAPPPALAKPGWQWPVRGEVLTHYRNGDDPYAAGQHRGIDIAAESGTPVVAAAGGSVWFGAIAGDSSLTVSIRTEDERFDTSYLHLGSIRVRARDAMRVEDELGTIGTTGRRSLVQPHLHFGIREAGSRHAYRDPLAFLPPPPQPEPRAPRAVPVLAPATMPPLPVLIPVPTLTPRPLAPLTDPLLSPASRPLANPQASPLPSPAPRPLASPQADRMPSPAPRPLAGPQAD